MPLKVRDVIRLLEKHDWRHVRTTADHRIYRNPDGRVTVVSGKLGDNVRPGMARGPEANWYKGTGTMTRKYSLSIEGELGSYSAQVPELPAILVIGQSLDELTAQAREAIRLYWESVRTDVSPTSILREIEVELPA